MKSCVLFVQVEQSKQEKIPEPKIYKHDNLRPYEVVIKAAAEVLAREKPNLDNHRGKKYV